MASDAESLQAELLRLRQFIKKFTPVMAKGTADGPLALHFLDYLLSGYFIPQHNLLTLRTLTAGLIPQLLFEQGSSSNISLRSIRKSV